jgi:hypothetical protein
MVQKLSAKGAPESFDEQILPRRPVRNPYLLDAAGVQELPHPEKLPDACQQVPEVPQEVDDGTHAALIARKVSDGNLP